MLSFQDFFAACAGHWITERTYHFVLQNDIERSHTEFQAQPLSRFEKEKILSIPVSTTGGQPLTVETATILQEDWVAPGFAISFDTVSDKGEQVSMSLKALFVPDAYVSGEADINLSLPTAAQVSAEAELVRGFYLRDEGYSETGAIAGRFTYQPIRQTLEMTTYYRRSVAVDQMRFVAPDLRMRTIVTYQRPEAHETPTVINLVGFGVEHKQKDVA